MLKLGDRRAVDNRDRVTGSGVGSAEGVGVDDTVDHVAGGVGEALVVVAGVATEPAESFVNGTPLAFDDHALGLLDHGAAGKSRGELDERAVGERLRYSPSSPGVAERRRRRRSD